MNEMESRIPHSKGVSENSGIFSWREYIFILVSFVAGNLKKFSKNTDLHILEI
jgi:hypothetical protein